MSGGQNMLGLARIKFPPKLIDVPFASFCVLFPHEYLIMVPRVRTLC